MSNAAVEAIVAAIRQVAEPGPVSLHEPRFSGHEWDYLKDCLDSTFVSSVGKFVNRFEIDLANYTGAKYAVALVNGTAALHIALHLAGVQPGDEVLIPTLTFVATANAVTYCGAIPHFIDSEASTLGVDPQALREYLNTVAEIRNNQCLNRSTGRVIRVLMPMHTFGHPSDLSNLLAVAQDFCLTLVEDAAESLGSFYRDQHTGTFGKMGVLSFNGNKTITTGGGGAILTNDAELASRAKHLTTTAKIPHRWEYVHDQIGYNYRMPNINAALGCAQLEQIQDFLIIKRSLFKKYQAAFKNIGDVSIFAEPHGCHSNYWLQTLVLNQSTAVYRDAILEATNDVGLMTRPVWTLIHKLAPYQDCPRMNVPVAELLERCLINLPSGVGLIDRQDK